MHFCACDDGLFVFDGFDYGGFVLVVELREDIVEQEHGGFGGGVLDEVYFAEFEGEHGGALLSAGAEVGDVFVAKPNFEVVAVGSDEGGAGVEFFFFVGGLAFGGDFVEVVNDVVGRGGFVEAFFVLGHFGF